MAVILTVEFTPAIFICTWKPVGPVLISVASQFVNLWFTPDIHTSVFQHSSFQDLRAYLLLRFNCLLWSKQTGPSTFCCFKRRLTTELNNRWKKKTWSGWQKLGALLWTDLVMSFYDADKKKTQNILIICKMCWLMYIGYGCCKYAEHRS